MSDVLQHYGIRGMKWGVRRFQQKDGSLTSQGRKRYGGEDGPERKKLPAAGKAAVGAAAAAGIVLTAYLVKRHGAKKGGGACRKGRAGKAGRGAASKERLRLLNAGQPASDSRAVSGRRRSAGGKNRCLGHKAGIRGKASSGLRLRGLDEAERRAAQEDVRRSAVVGGEKSGNVSWFQAETRLERFFRQ